MGRYTKTRKDFPQPYYSLITLLTLFPGPHQSTKTVGFVFTFIIFNKCQKLNKVSDKRKQKILEK